MSTTPRRRRPSHRSNLGHLSRPWQPLRAAALERSFSELIEFGEEDAYIDEDGDLYLSLGGLLKTMVASRPETLNDHVRRERCRRMREVATAVEASRAISEQIICTQIQSYDVAEGLIARLGGEDLRQAHDAGDEPFLAYLDRALAHRLG